MSTDEEAELKRRTMCFEGYFRIGPFPNECSGCPYENTCPQLKKYKHKKCMDKG